MNIYSHGDVLRRREEIVHIVHERSVSSQDELLAVLKKRGFKVTQPTLSRDLRELGVAKTPNGYIAAGELASITPITALTPLGVREDRFWQLVRDAVLSADDAGNLVVIKTPPAAAQPVASAMDAASLDDSLGCIGGDDTIFVAFRTAASAHAFARRLQDVAGIAPPRRHARP
ncbi:MAG TPA: arginine repressor [Thermoanaerobaculia bacterium]|nr:arginine repressor [Thermoanaerobaculia bacterium]